MDSGEIMVEILLYEKLYSVLRLNSVHLRLNPVLASTIVNLFSVFECSDFTGSVLRVDVDTDFCTSPYSIPRNNPYFNSTNQPPEIFAHGLHDPGRLVRLLKRCINCKLKVVLTASLTNTIQYIHNVGNLEI